VNHRTASDDVQHKAGEPAIHDGGRPRIVCRAAAHALHSGVTNCLTRTRSLRGKSSAGCPSSGKFPSGRSIPGRSDSEIVGQDSGRGAGILKVPVTALTEARSVSHRRVTPRCHAYAGYLAAPAGRYLDHEFTSVLASRAAGPSRL
jgi:hypothetical protein